MMAKLLYTMGEVTEMFDVNASLIRYWESKFDCIKPQKNKKGNRLFTPSDIENFKLIYHLVKEKGMTLEGANNTMKRRGKKLHKEVSILERLQSIRAMLVEVRESLGESAEYEAPIEAVSDLIADVEKEAKAHVVEVVTTPDEVAAAELVDDVKTEEEVAPEPRRRGRPRKVVEGDTAETTAPRRRTKKKEENQELFPFYEQSLF
ncbi:MAG: MerR family transcriptional regulator [Alistipes sp.]|nr:MerR family transcriptional regulator [Alistipes sp.]